MFDPFSRAAPISRSALWLGWLVGLGLWLSGHSGAVAQSADAGVAASSSSVPLPVLPKKSYEQRRTDLLLQQQGLVVDAAPEGKRIAFVRVARDDVFVKEEIWPLWFNWFHGRTREYVVRRELLFAEGSVYENDRIEETMRNLRSMGIFALVRIVPVQGEKPGEVGVLVHTRDLWSLRLETGFNITKDVVNELVIRGTELNLFGHNKSAAVDFTLLPQSYWITQSYVARRVLNSAVSFQERSGPVFRRGTNEIEGEYVYAALGQPFYRLSQRFSWTARGSHTRRVQRYTQYGDVKLFPDPEYYRDGPFALQAFRYQYDSAALLGQMRHGELVKNTFTLGWDYRSTKVATLDETELPPELTRAFALNVMPQPRTDHGPYLSYEFFVPRWATFVNLATFGQSENVRVGPSGSFLTRVPIKQLGSTATAWVLAGELGMVLAPRGFLLDGNVTGSTRLVDGRWIDQYGKFQVRGATPVFWIFRFVTRAYVELRHYDSQRTNVTLGANNGLRGYESDAFGRRGGDRFLANFELRTLPIEWEALQVGLVLFYDVGSVFLVERQNDFMAHHAVGAGLRILFPQLNRTPFSADAGFAFNPFDFVGSFSSAQVVPLTAAEDPT
ncbi:MAG TPA: BamA/TamA family outer membrane protein [Polyangiaceae bacterium]|nr:BamA/TamA family outer membrane protein [Polyangiaceae bacterium]